MKTSCNRSKNTRTTVFARLAGTLLMKMTVAVALTAMLVQSGCLPVRSNAAVPQDTARTSEITAGNTETDADTTGTTVVKGADTGYYFDSANKLVALEALSGLGREIELSDMFANEDGLTLVLKSTCQSGIPTFEGETEMVGKASTVVYAVAGPSVLVVLGVEDLTNVPSRIIEPMKPVDRGAICCCAARRCNGALCCPCQTTC